MEISKDLLIKTSEQFGTYGGQIKDAIGIPDLELKKASKSIVTKTNVDTDGRLVFKSSLLDNIDK